VSISGATAARIAELIPAFSDLAVPPKSAEDAIVDVLKQHVEKNARKVKLAGALEKAKAA
jgi:hypothetical protein